MKRIITIALSAIATIAVSAKEKNPVEKICEKIYSAIPSLPRLDKKTKAYAGNGHVSYSHNANLDAIFFAKDSTDYKNKKVLNKMISIVKHDLDPLMKLSEGNEHFESHSDDADTIKYSICLSNGPVIPQEQKMGNITVIGPDDDETVTFNYTRNIRNYQYRGHSEFVSLSYNKNEFLPNKTNQKFDKLAYLEKITPVLKHKDIKSWDFNWSYDKAYYDQYNNSYNKEDIDMFYFLKGDEAGGKAIGTIYFIPKENKELAETVLASLDDLTLDYTEKNPNQDYRYNYNMKDWMMRYTEGIGHNIKEMLITNMHSQSSTYVFYGISSQGYYVAIADTENNFCIPQKWYALKRFINGKKEYIPGYKKGETEPLLFPSIPK